MIDPAEATKDLSTCTGKEAYSSKQAAQITLDRMLRRKAQLRSKGGFRLHPYPCQHCPFWHLGGTVP